MEERGEPNLYFSIGDPISTSDWLGLLTGSPLSMANSILYSPNKPDFSPPSRLESFIPAYGPVKEMEYDLSHGNLLEGTLDMAVAISDMLLLTSIVRTLGPGCWKSGSHSWSATRKWYGKEFNLEPHTHVHHQIIQRNGRIGRHLPDWLKNQPWNLTPIYPQIIGNTHLSSREIHSSIHGAKKYRVSGFLLWDIKYSQTAKLFQVGGVLRLLFLFSLEKEGEAEKVYLDCKEVEE